MCRKPGSAPLARRPSFTKSEKHANPIPQKLKIRADPSLPLNVTPFLPRHHLLSPLPFPPQLVIMVPNGSLCVTVGNDSLVPTRAGRLWWESHMTRAAAESEMRGSEPRLYGKREVQHLLIYGRAQRALKHSRLWQRYNRTEPLVSSNKNTSGCP